MKAVFAMFISTVCEYPVKVRVWARPHDAFFKRLPGIAFKGGPFLIIPTIIGGWHTLNVGAVSPEIVRGVSIGDTKGYHRPGPIE